MSEYFLIKDEYSEKYFLIISKFLENNASVLDKKDIIKLIEIFISSDKFFKILFEKIDLFNINYEKEMIHKRVEIYLEESENIEKNKNNILEIIKNEKFIGKYDTQFLMMLFKYYNFKEGIELLCEVNKYNQHLLMIYIQKRDYKNIILLCEKFGKNNIALWYRSLDFFIAKEYRTNLNQEEIKILNTFLEKFLVKLLESEALIDLNILEIINDKNNDISLDLINKFLNKALEKQYLLISEQEKKYNEYDKEINETMNEIKEIRTKAHLIDFNKCSECSLPLNLPFITFFCGHSFHNFCYNTRHNSNDKNMFCIKCKEKKNIIEEEYKNIKSSSNNYNDINKIENELNKNLDKLDFMHQLYGKGLINLELISDDEIIRDNNKNNNINNDYNIDIHLDK